MRIAILGTRGIPASFSGFETAAEQLASRLSERGHEVVVYCRAQGADRGLRAWKGARLVHLPTIRSRYLDTFAHTLLSSLHAARRLHPDVALFFDTGTRPMRLVPRSAEFPTVRVDVVPHGVEDPGEPDSWDAVADRYERMLRQACEMRGPGVLPPELVDAA